MAMNVTSASKTTLSDKQTTGLKRSIELNQGLFEHLLELQDKLAACRISIKNNADILQRKRKRRLFSST